MCRPELPRVLVPNEGPGDEAKRTALREATEIAQAANPQAEVVLLFETLRNVSTLDSVLSREQAESLNRNRSATINGVRFRVQTVKDFSPQSEENVILGVHISESSGIRKLDDARTAQAIVFLPWLHREGRDWKATWRPRCTSNAYDDVPDFSLEPTLESGLSELPNQIGHPLDDDRMKKGLKKLRKSFPAVDGTIIRRWALRAGFDSADADKIMKWFK